MCGAAPTAGYPGPGCCAPDRRRVVADAWRGCARFIQGDDRPRKAFLASILSLPPPAEAVRDYRADYGATLVELPDDTWQTSVAQWVETH